MTVTAEKTTDLFDLDDILGDALDGEEQSETAPAEVAATEKCQRRRAPVVARTLYFDLETVPDYSREELFGLDPIPTAGPRTAAKDMLAIDQLRTASLDEVRQVVKSKRPSDEYLAALEAAEKADKKPRKGLFDLIEELRGEAGKVSQAIDDRRKTMSCTPEMCRIVSFGWAMGDDGAMASVFGEKGGTADHDTYERCVLRKFWELAARAKLIVGFNVIGFDLPVIYTRSMLLGVEPSRKIDLKPWGGEVCDVMAARWPKGGQKKMKDFCRMLGLPIPAGDVDGSQVESLLKADPAKVADYNRSDVSLTREIHLMGRGFFW